MMNAYWTMLSHYHGQILNYSELGRSFGVSDMTVRRYCEILEGAFMVRLLAPWGANVGKRVVRRPKLYLRDSGVAHALMSIESMGQLRSSPKLGASWEGFALECVCRVLDREDEEFFFWRTHAGAELDLLWQWGGRNWGVECKYQDAPPNDPVHGVGPEGLGAGRAVGRLSGPHCVPAGGEGPGPPAAGHRRYVGLRPVG